VCNVTAGTIAAGTATGFTFERAIAGELREAVVRAFELWKKPAQWRRVRQSAMSQDFTWEAAALRYVDLYRELRPLAG